MKKRENGALVLAAGAVSLAAVVLVLAPIGCGDDSDGSGGTGGTMATGGTGGTGGTAGGGGSAGDDAGGSGELCGGFASVRCAAPESTYCDYAEMVECGHTDGSGICKPRPDNCVAGGPSVCGCDGKLYTNECEAHRAGTDDNPTGSCSSNAR